jgi:signal transduction histidine kinase
LERTRIAREIHDGLVQALAGVALQLETAQLSPSQESAQLHFERALDLARQGVQDARRAIDDLRPASALKHTEFSETVRAMAQHQLDKKNICAYRSRITAKVLIRMFQRADFSESSECANEPKS